MRSNLYLRNRSWKSTRHTAANCPFNSKSQATLPRRVAVPSQRNIVVTVWKDKKPVYFLSSQSDLVGNDTVGRRQRDGTVIQVPSAPVVKTYNNNTGSIDLNDQCGAITWLEGNRKSGGVVSCGSLWTLR